MRRVNTPNKSLDSLVVATLFCWVWPLSHSVLVQMIEAAGYALKLGGGLLNLLACGLAIACALVLSVLLFRARRREHAPLNPDRIVLLLLSCTAGASVLLIACLLAMGMFCEVGTCPRPN